MSATKPRSVAELVDLVGVMRRAEGFAEVREALLRGESAAIDGAWGSSCALTAAALAGDQLVAGAGERGRPANARRQGGPPPPCEGGETSSAERISTAEPVLLVVLPRISEVDDFAVDLAGFMGRAPDIFPAWEALPREQHATDPVLTGRMRVLRSLDESP